MQSRWIERAAELAGAEPVLWERLTWPAVEKLLQTDRRLVLLPVAATEQHGPHLPLCTDTAIGTAVAAYASAKTGVPVMPTMPYGVSVGHTEKWPGTVSLMHETLALALREIVAWLTATGFDRILLLNSHFGNDATLRVAVDRLRFDHGPALQINTLNTFFLDESIKAYFLSDGEDIHANKAETDLMLYLDPEACDMAAVEDDPDRTAGTVFSYVVPRTSTNGITGAPSQGSPEQGEALLEEMGEALAGILEKAKTEEAPLPWHRPGPTPSPLAVDRQRRHR
jgi:creatinine amidohydrolase